MHIPEEWRIYWLSEMLSRITPFLAACRMSMEKAYKRFCGQFANFQLTITGRNA
jgi:hypothetical protein